MRADTLRGQVGGGWALKFESFLGAVEWHRGDIGECHFSPKILEINIDSLHQKTGARPPLLYNDRKRAS